MESKGTVVAVRGMVEATGTAGFLVLALGPMAAVAGLLLTIFTLVHPGAAYSPASRKRLSTWS